MYVLHNHFTIFQLPFCMFFHSPIPVLDGYALAGTLVLKKTPKCFLFSHLARYPMYTPQYTKFVLFPESEAEVQQKQSEVEEEEKTAIGKVKNIILRLTSSFWSRLPIALELWVVCTKWKMKWQKNRNNVDLVHLPDDGNSRWYCWGSTQAWLSSWCSSTVMGSKLSLKHLWFSQPVFPEKQTM